MPSISFTMKFLTSSFDLMKQKLKEELAKQCHLCLTTDIWTHRRRSFLGISVHYIDESFLRKSYILAFKRMKQRHTFDYLASCLKEVLDDYGIPESKVTNIVTDGGSNFCKAFRIYGRDEDFSRTLATIQMDEEEDDDEDAILGNIDDFLFTPDENTLQILNDGESTTNEEVTGEKLTDEQIEAEINNLPIQMDQIELPNEACETINGEIVLPPQMRCFSHLLSLIGNFCTIQMHLITKKF